MNELIKLMEESEGQIKFEPFYSELTVVIFRYHKQWIVEAHDSTKSRGMQEKLYAGDSFDEAVSAAKTACGVVA